MKLSFAPLHNMPVQKQVVLIFLGVIVFIIVFYLLLCKPKAMATNALQSQLQQQWLVLQNVQRELRDMPDPAGYYLQLQEQEARVKSLLPDSDAIPDLLVTLNTLGKQQNVKINSIKQGAFVDRKTHYEIPLEMTITGTYPDLLQFINKIENLRRFNSIIKIGVHPEETLLHMQLSAVVYVYGSMPQNIQSKSK